MVHAATGSLVNIADGTNASQLAKVDTAGRLTTFVAGTVYTHEQSQTAAFTDARGGSSSASCQAVYAPPSGKSAVIDDVSVDQWAGTNAAVVLRLWVSPTSAPCGSGLAGYFSSPTANTTFERHYTVGLGIPAGYAVYADQYAAGSSPNSYVFAFHGYTAASTYVPAPTGAATATAKTGPNAPR